MPANLLLRKDLMRSHTNSSIEKKCYPNNNKSAFQLKSINNLPGDEDTRTKLRSYRENILNKSGQNSTNNSYIPNSVIDFDQNMT